MAQVTVPQAASQDPAGKLKTPLALAAAIPGPQQPFAAAGSVLLSAAERNPQQAPQVQANSGAMQRRLQELDQLRQADSAVAQLPPQQQQQYGPAIRRARIMAEQQEGYA